MPQLAAGRSDENLIKAIATGDQAAMRTLYARHHLRVYHFIVRLGSDTDRAEDLVSEVFLSVWRQAGTFENRSQVCTWILSIARFKALTALGRRREPQLDEDAIKTVADDADTPEQRFFTPTDARSSAAVLHRCLRITTKSLTSFTTTRSRSKRSPRFFAFRRTP